jgi:hypothetical protein
MYYHFSQKHKSNNFKIFENLNKILLLCLKINKNDNGSYINQPNRCIEP